MRRLPKLVRGPVASGKRREDVRGPRNPRDLGHDRGLVNQLSGEQQIRATFGLDHREQLLVALANGGKEYLAECAFRPLADVH